MIKFRNRELKRHNYTKPQESMRYLELYCVMKSLNIHVKAIIEREGLNYPMDFVLNGDEYENFLKMSGVFKTTLKSGEPYLFRFLPSDKLIVLEDNYDEAYDTERDRVREKREKYKELYRNKLQKWQDEHNAIMAKPFIYWETRKKTYES